jgi:hypothetical protein
MAISCVVEYPEDYGHERFYGITPGKRLGLAGISRAKPLASLSPSHESFLAISLQHKNG